MGAGVQAFEAYTAADAQGLRIVGGTCPTVGIAGGYTQGGGHSILSSVYGLGADQVLEWEVVTAAGEHLIATPEKNSDLYWALSGGGGGTYAVVISMTSKAYQDGLISGASLTFTAGNLSSSVYWGAVEAFHAALPGIVDAGGQAAYTVSDKLFYLQPVTFPGRSKTWVKNFLSPLLSDLQRRGIIYTLSVSSFPTFLQHFSTYFGPLPYGPYASAQVQGSRFIPRSVVQRNNTGLTSTMREIAKSGKYYMLCVALNANHTTSSDNAVLPAWRNMLLQVEAAAVWDYENSWDSNLALQKGITEWVVPMLETLTGTEEGTGAYMNEANYEQTEWQRTFYGENYERLRKVKRKWDNRDLFYATTAVGSEVWTKAHDGRLCRT